MGPSLTGRLPFEITRRATRDIAEASAWWDANRPKAPEAFREEMDRAIDLITSHPSIGALARDVRLADARRILLNRVRYFLYYRLSASGKKIVILALWHTSRGSAPKL
ncbi:MAG: type II toxin-antitoxin system RelE/ParE family toxin [Thermoanaerobaculia bacterium]